MSPLFVIARNKVTKRSRQIFTFIFLSLLLTSCTYRVERPQDSLAVSLRNDPETLNPVLSNSSDSASVLEFVYERLITLDSDTLEYRARLAKRWEASPDHLQYTFWLRDDVRWHDGRPFTADDVIYTFERIRDPKVDAARLRSYFKDLAKIEKIDGNAVRFVFSKPYFRAQDICGRLQIISKHIFEDSADFNTAAANRAPVGTGPFKFERWNTGRDVRLTGFEGYWGERPAISSIRFHIIPDQIVSFLLLKKGGLDMENVGPLQWTRQTNKKAFEENFTRHRYFSPNFSFIGWNTRRPFFNDARVRRAMTMLINRRVILDKVLFGQGEEVTGPFYKFGKYYNNAIEPVPYDPDAAMRLLFDAGWVDSNGDGVREKDGVPFRFELMFAAGNNFARALSLLVREDMQRAGIKMDVAQMEASTMGRFITRRQFDAVALGWLVSLEPEPYQLWHSSQSSQGSNFVGFNSARADELIEKARSEFDPEKRAVLYHELQSIIYDEQPYTFLFTTPTLELVAKRFEDVVYHRLGPDILEWKLGEWRDIYEW